MSGIPSAARANVRPQPPHARPSVSSRSELRQKGQRRIWRSGVDTAFSPVNLAGADPRVPCPNTRLTAVGYAHVRATGRTSRAAEACCAVTVALAALVALPASLLTIWGLLHTSAARQVVAAPREARWH